MADVETTKMDEEVSPLEKDHSLSVVLPSGLEKNATVHGSKPVMDLLVTLCASYHLNPSDYTVEFLSQNKNNISFKPNSLIGSLEAEKMVLKPKGAEEKIRMPYVPEATVRLLINYNKSHKAVVRVSPRVPLETLLPLVCDKCEFGLESTVLLRDSESRELLDLSRTLNELGLREVFAKDTAAKDSTGHTTAAAIPPTKVTSASSLQDLSKKEKKKSENKGFLSLFRKHRKKSEPDQTVSVPSSPGLTKQRSVSLSTQGVSPCVTPTSDMPKKRRAPQPPMGASHSTPNNLSTCHLQGSQRSGENTLRSTKRRAPAPPVVNHQQEDTTTDCLNSLEGVGETEEPESVTSSASSPCPPSPPHLLKDPLPRPTFLGKTKDRSDARSALAKVLTTSLSTGMLVKRLKNPKHKNGTSCSENGFEIKSVLNTNLPTENEWEDPAEKKGLTTFKVVPSRKSSDAEPTLDILHLNQAAVEVNKAVEEAATKIDQSRTQEETPDQLESREPDQSAHEAETTTHSVPHDNHGSVTEVEDIVETPKQDEETCTNDLKEEAQSDLDHKNVTNEDDLYLGDKEEVVEVSSGEYATESKTCDSKTSCDILDKGGVQEEDDNFPPPPPPVYFNEDLEEATTSSSVCASARSVTNGHVRSNSEPTQNSHSPENGEDKTVSAPSRFAQAVALAVQRSRLHSTGKTAGPHIN